MYGRAGGAGRSKFHAPGAQLPLFVLARRGFARSPAPRPALPSSYSPRVPQGALKVRRPCEGTPAPRAPVRGEPPPPLQGPRTGAAVQRCATPGPLARRRAGHWWQFYSPTLWPRARRKAPREPAGGVLPAPSVGTFGGRESHRAVAASRISGDPGTTRLSWKGTPKKSPQPGQTPGRKCLCAPACVHRWYNAEGRGGAGALTGWG